MKDPYDILGVSRSASPDQIRKAYRRLAKTLHPDLNPGNKAAEAQFKAVSAAYDLLGDADKRTRFDAGEIDASGADRAQAGYYKDYASRRSHDDPYGGGAAFADMADVEGILGELFRRQEDFRRYQGGDGRRLALAIELPEAVNGTTKWLHLPDNRSVPVVIPPGTEDGQILIAPGRGASSSADGGPADLAIRIVVRPHRLFRRQGDDIHLDLPVSLSEAVLGAKIRAPTLSGPVMLNIPKGSDTGVVLRLKGKGVARGALRGDQLVRLKVVLPQEPDAELEAFLSHWTPSPSYNPRRDIDI